MIYVIKSFCVINSSAQFFLKFKLEILQSFSEAATEVFHFLNDYKIFRAYSYH